MHEEGDHATKNQLSGVLLQGDGLEERLEQWECILHDQHGRLLPQRLANGPLHHHHFAQIRRKEEAPLCEPTHVEKSATSKGFWEADFEREADFEFLDVLGEGAFGKVFLARQVSLNRLVALKVTANLGHEARTMASLDHDNIVHVFSETVDPRHTWRLLCMQYVPGATLHCIIRELVSRGDRSQWNGQTILSIIDGQLKNKYPVALDPTSLRDRTLLNRCDLHEAVCWLGQRLAEALAHAHNQGVLHRDIKPSNILVNLYGRPMLADFNLSFQAAEEYQMASAMFGGTLAYMSPEHLDALNRDVGTGSEAVDERSDIYSLGVVLVEFLTGERPFDGKLTNVDGAIDLREMATERRRSESLMPLLERFAVPKMLARILRRCLNPDPQGRYQTASELAEALAACRQLLSIEKDLPRGGMLSRFAVCCPFWFILLLTIVPNVSASVIALLYNTLMVIGELPLDQQRGFARLVIWYNLVILPVMGLMAYRVLAFVWSFWRKAGDFLMTGSSEIRAVREQVLTFPRWGAIMSCIGWMPYAVVIPVGMQLFAGPITSSLLWHISAAYVVIGLIALVHNFYVIEFAMLQGMYPRLWTDVERVREAAANELRWVPPWNRLFQRLAVLIPLAAAILFILTSPDQFTIPVFQMFKFLITVLITIGIAGLWLAMTATGVLNQAVSVWTRSK